MWKRLLLLGSVLVPLSSALGADGPYKFYSVVPCRILDTRAAGGGGRFALGEIRNLRIATKCGIPTAARMAALNITVVGPATEGHITVYPFNPADPSAVPLTSTVNWTAGESAIANGSVVSLTNNPTYNISVAALASLDLIIDVTAYLQ